MLGRTVPVLLAALLLVACVRGDDRSTRASGDPAVVSTATGTVRGAVVADHRLFAGIPYAAPPLGPLRFRPPAPAPGWAGVRDATRPGPRCVQDPADDVEAGRNTDEDCLTLNVWTPPVGGRPRPVLVWIHGGGFVNGSGDIYDARWMVSRGDVVVVTLNYRLGTLGFLAHPALGPPGDVGNYGLADQQAALRWVRDNIASFGGDPEQVTVAGESAGGMSVCDHLVAPGSAGLFRSAIIQSAPCQKQARLPVAQRAALDYAAEAGCRDPAAAAQCLRALPLDKLRKPVRYNTIGRDQDTGPVTGTAVLPVDPITGFTQGRAARVPVLIGTNRDEYTLPAALEYLRLRSPITVQRYPQLLEQPFGSHAPVVAARYPPERYDSPPLAYAAAGTDGVYACPADRMAGALSRDRPVYAYEFADRTAPAPEVLRLVPFPLGASHSLELRYLFDVGGAPALNPAQEALSDQMIDRWSAFVRTGAPGPDWPRLGDGQRMSLQLGGSRMFDDFDRAHQCAFWAGLSG